MISRPRRRGNAKLRRILEGAVDPAHVRSVLELRFLRMCASYGIPRPEVNVRFGRWTPDFLWPDHGLFVETDGYEYLRAAGLNVARLTWADVTEPTAQTAARVRDATNVT